MKLFKYLFAVCSIFLFSSCLVTLNPLFNSDDYIPNDSILGKWVSHSKNSYYCYWEFQKETYTDNTNKVSYWLKFYEVEDSVTGDTAEFRIGLGKIGKSYFIDIFPMSISKSDSTKYSSPKNSFYNMHQIPVYTFYKIQFENDTLLLLRMDYDWFKKSQKSGKININHSKKDNESNEVITASTKDLKKFVKKFSENKEAFSDTLKLVRIK